LHEAAMPKETMTRHKDHSKQLVKMMGTLALFFDDKLCENWKRYDRWYFRMTQLPNDTVTSPVLLSALSWTSIVLLHASSPKPVIFIPPIPIWIKGEDEVPIVISSFARQFLAQRCFEGHPPS